MKYIKLFENLYYKKVSNLLSFYTADSLTFTEEEKDGICNIARSGSLTISIYKHSIELKSITKGSSNVKYFTIYKLPDEWYIVLSERDIYKCDQMDGLKKFIEEYR